MTKTKHRYDLDGLKGIAILMIVLFHFFPLFFPGGYLGVDIFFILSGFFIARTTLNSLAQNNFSFKNFYIKRFSRLLPVLFFMLAVVIAIAWFVLFPDEFIELGKHVMSSLMFILNFTLWKESGNYFDTAFRAKILLHLWFLGIIMQFYIFWSLLVFFFKKKKKILNNLTIIFFFLSFATYLLSFSFFSAKAIFYLPVFRFWEILAGATLAFSLFEKKAEKENFLLKEAVSILSFILIISALFFGDSEKDFFHIWILLSIIGSAFIILSADSFLSKKILNNKILVYLGLISYSLYLWHWPLVSFLYILQKETFLIKILTLLLSILLSFVSYELIEKKIKFLKSKNLIYILMFFALFFFVIAWGMKNKKILPRNNKNNYMVKNVLEAKGDWDLSGFNIENINRYRVFTKGKSKRKILFLGDSHMEQYMPRLLKLIEKNGLDSNRLELATFGGCPFVLHFYNLDHDNCNDNFKKDMISYALSSDIEAVVIGGAWGNYFTSRQTYYYKNNKQIFSDKDYANGWLKLFEETIALLVKKKKVFLILDNPTGNNFDPITILKETRITKKYKKQSDWVKYTSKKRKINFLLSQVAKKYNVTVINPLDYLCKGDYCLRMVNGKPIYKDSGHLRKTYVENYVTFLDFLVVKKGGNF